MNRKNINIERNIQSGARRLNGNRLRLLGFLPLTFFSAQAIHYWQINELGNMLWLCNIGNLLLALGLFFEAPKLIRVAVLWTVPGVAIWFVYVVPTWGMLLTGRFSYAELFGVLSSTLAHLGGFAVGIAVLRKVGMDARAWLYAFVWYFVVQLISRLVTPAAMNVNLSHTIQAGWEKTFSTYWSFWFVFTILVGACLWFLEVLLKRIWPVSRALIETGVP
ncbi:MAG TPA: hypothetical protein VGJ48_15225 [Pyrinomonadaceae bacterium]